MGTNGRFSHHMNYCEINTSKAGLFQRKFTLLLTKLLCIKIMQPVAITLFFHLMLLLFSGIYHVKKGAQRLSGRVLDSRLRVQDSPASLRRGP